MAAMSLTWETYFTLGRPLVMGIVNITPDSFFPASRVDPGKSSQLAERIAGMIGDGADILDFGAESTRPGAAPVSEAEEAERLVPAVRLARSLSGLPISVDTRNVRVARLALDAGADIINDISAGCGDDGAMLDLAAQRQCPLVLMHMQGQPASMQDNPQYGAVVDDVSAWLAGRVRLARERGVRHLLVDPGLGFGKTSEHNLALVANCGRLAAAFDCPLLIGHSRKSFIGQVLASRDDDGNVTARKVEERLAGSLAVAAWCLLNGAMVIRTHDVAETSDLVRMLNAIRARQEVACA
jgi:dihydropteroate synthase